jgi:hypothetical protein
MKTVISESEKDIKADSTTATDLFLINEYVKQKKNCIHDNKGMTTRKEFTNRLIQSGTLIEIKRLWPFTFSMIGIGLSFGITAPAFFSIMME